MMRSPRTHAAATSVLRQEMRQSDIKYAVNAQGMVKRESSYASFGTYELLQRRRAYY